MTGNRPRMIQVFAYDGKKQAIQQIGTVFEVPGAMTAANDYRKVLAGSRMKALSSILRKLKPPDQ